MLNLSKEDIQFLKDLGKELREQDTDCQASPRFWTVGDYEERIGGEGYGSEVKYLIPDWDYALLTFDELKLRLLEDEDNDFTPEELEEIKNIEYYDDILSYIRGCCEEPREVEVSKEHIKHNNTMFITKQDAKDHIKANHYHYTKEAHTYGLTAWRSPKVERLWKILEKIGLDDDNITVYSKSSCLTTEPKKTIKY